MADRNLIDLDWLETPSENPVLQLTEEQKLIIGTEIKRGELLKIDSYAGSSKTTVLREYAKSRLDENFLYIAFNTNVAAEAKESFPLNVTPRTIHSLAFGAVGHKYRPKLGYIKPYMLKEMGVEKFAIAKFIIDVVQKFNCSADLTINESHLLLSGESLESYTEKKDPSTIKYLLKKANELWDHMKDVKSPIPMTHDGYLKLYQLSKPYLDYDYIMLDEGHDTNAVTFDIFINQTAAKIMVYDKNQSIYQFRWANEEICDAKGDKTRYLSTSFRFGSNVADIANDILKNIKGIKRPLVGFKSKDSVAPIDEKRPYAIIANTNSALFDEAARIVSEPSPPKFYFLGSVEKENFSPMKAYYFDRILDVYNLYIDHKAAIKDFYIMRFKDYKSFLQTINDADCPDVELQSRAKVVNKYKHDIPALVQKIIANSGPAEQAHVTFSTAHKSKGREFNQVKLTHDYTDLVVTDEITHKPRLVTVEEAGAQSINLLYVAATRAKEILQPNIQILKLREFLGKK